MVKVYIAVVTRQFYARVKEFVCRRPPSSSHFHTKRHENHIVRHASLPATNRRAACFLRECQSRSLVAAAVARMSTTSKV